MRQVTKKGLITVAAASGVLAMTSGTAFADSDARGGSERSPGVLSGNSVELPVDAPVNVCGNSADVAGVLNPATGNGCGNGDGNGGGNGGGQESGSGAHAHGGTSDSPGVGSGNSVQVPVDLPVNVCGNSVDVVGIGSPAAGNGCGNEESPGNGGPGGPGGPEEPGGGTPSQPNEPGGPGNPGGPGEPHSPEQPGNPPAGQTPGGPEQPLPWETPGDDDVVHGSSQPEAPAAPGASRAPARAASAVSAPGTGTGTGAEAAAPERGELAQTGSGAQLGVVAPFGVGMVLGGYVLYRRSRPAARR
ncbi:chaplin [Streptomyces sp. NPDC048172]|uniref:chaplin n=1 Tax=Streptomyces sp. NPDC048172 TaxID=3365505 RepID=UPI003718536D